MLDYINKPIGALEVMACSSIDPACSNPVTPTTLTDADGYFTLTLTKNFRGYVFAKKAPPHIPDLMPGLEAILPPPDKDDDKTGTIGPDEATILLEYSQLTYLLQTVQGPTAVKDPALGHIFGSVVDCSGKPAAGVSLSVSIRTPKTIPFYYSDNGTPSTTTSVTSSNGFAGFINLPPGYVDIDLDVSGTGKRVGRYSILVRADSSTSVNFSPAPIR